MKKTYIPLKVDLTDSKEMAHEPSQDISHSTLTNRKHRSFSNKRKLRQDILVLVVIGKD